MCVSEEPAARSQQRTRKKKAAGHGCPLETVVSYHDEYVGVGCGCGGNIPFLMSHPVNKA